MADSIKSVDVPSVHGMVALNPDGTAIGTPVGGATAANQTNGSQKTQIVDSGGEAVTVTDGKLDVNATVEASIDTTGLATSAKQDTIIGHVDGIEGLLTTIDSDTGTIATEVAGLLTDTELRATPVPVSGTVAVTHAALTELGSAINSDKVDVNIASSGISLGGTSSADDADFTDGTTAGTPGMGVYESTPSTVTDGDLGVVGITEDRRLKVLADLGAVDNAVLDTIAAKDFATQTTLAAMNAKMVSGTDIGDVTINNSTGAAAVNIQDGGNTITVDGTVAATQSGTWNIGTVTAVTAISNALPAGANAIGKLAANSGVDIGDVDVTSVSGTVTTKGIPSDIDINGANANHADKYYTNAGAVTDGIIWSPAAGKRWHVLNLTINVSAACTVTIEDDLAAGDNPRLKFEFAANSGITIPYNKEHPFSSGEDAADLLITTTAGNVYVQAVGYEV